MGLTLFGRRKVRFVQGDGIPDVTVSNVPGIVYMGQVTGAHHQVHHEAASSGEQLSLPGLGDCSVTIMFRCALFAHNRARLRGTTPSPVALFHTIVESFRLSCASLPFRLPTLVEVKAMMSTEVGSSPAPSSKRARR